MVIAFICFIGLYVSVKVGQSQKLEDVMMVNNDTVRVHHRKWKDNFHQYYSTTYSIYRLNYDSSLMHRNQLVINNVTSSTDYWGQVYDSLYQYNRHSLKRVEDSLRNIGTLKGLNAMEFADMVVSFIQDIPYNYVLWNDPCTEANADAPCVTGENFGILSPNEFLARLVGDCDTRSVTLYLLLKNLGYKPLILVSQRYRHAALALDLPTRGEPIIYKNKKYYFWETTNVGWRYGMIPPSCKELRYWEVALD